MRYTNDNILTNYNNYMKISKRQQLKNNRKRQLIKQQLIKRQHLFQTTISRVNNFTNKGYTQSSPISNGQVFQNKQF